AVVDGVCLPAATVVPQYESISLGGEALERGCEEALEYGRISHVDFTWSSNHGRTDRVLIGVRQNAVYARICPVAFRVVVTLGAVDEDDHVDVAANAELHFVQVDQAELLEVIVGIEINGDRPFRWVAARLIELLEPGLCMQEIG